MKKPVVYGVANSNGPAVLFAFKRGRYYTMALTEDEDRPGDVDEEIRLRRRVGNERRAFIAVVTGSATYLQECLSQLREPDYIFFCGDEELLEDMDLRVIDKGWIPGAKQIDAESFIDSRFRASASTHAVQQSPPSSQDENERAPTKELIAGALGYWLGRRKRKEENDA